jgi:hypothetical protein
VILQTCNEWGDLIGALRDCDRAFGHKIEGTVPYTLGPRTGHRPWSRTLTVPYTLGHRPWDQNTLFLTHSDRELDTDRGSEHKPRAGHRPWDQNTNCSLHTRTANWTQTVEQNTDCFLHTRTASRTQTVGP